MDNVGKKIKDIRTTKNKTISQISNEHVSPGTISLIENGKMQPSIERLKHIARNLDVEITDIIGSHTKEVLREEISTFQEKAETEDLDVLIKGMERLQDLLKGIGVGFEAAKIHELYAKNAYYLFVHANHYYITLDDRDWNDHANKSLEIYQYLEMEWKVLDIMEFLANVEYLNGNYSEVINIIDRGIKQSIIDKSMASKSVYINLVVLRIEALSAQGEYDEAINHIDQAIQYSKTNMVLHKFYELNNMKTILLYNDFQTERAQETTKIIDTFVNLVGDKYLLLEMKFTHIHYAEFFESDMEKTKNLLDDAKEYVENMLQDENKSIQMDAETFINDAEARYLTKIGRYEEAMHIFQNNKITFNKNIVLDPIDFGLRKISDSYLAYCYLCVGRQMQEANRIAKNVVDALKKFPHTAYYQFSRKVLSDIHQSKQNDGPVRD